ncbi:hypothetical protein PR048_003061 [Dryococelus australis]|uniref:Uncharacterized protein n=1 Tax=Dryococelus australis TaxID=614101 RepID=A0ABQ9IN00_9NEOP|nr:hypothetical protein PR048_003061 [Dryococelus australis]
MQVHPAATYPHQWSGRWVPITWSPDPTLIDYFVWGHIMQKGQTLCNVSEATLATVHKLHALFDHIGKIDMEESFLELHSNFNALSDTST